MSGYGKTAKEAVINYFYLRNALSIWISILVMSNGLSKRKLNDFNMLFGLEVVKAFAACSVSLAPFTFKAKLFEA